MLAPSKTISIGDSTLNRAARLGLKIDEDIELVALYRTVKKDFKDLAEFIDALDLLFILGKMDFDIDQGVIKIA